MGVYSGSVPTFLAGELPDADKFLEISNFMTAATSAMTVWTPTLTNLTIGNGSVVAAYTRLGKHVWWRFKFTYGSSGSAVGTAPKFTLPVAPSSAYGVFTDAVGRGTLVDQGVTPAKLAIVMLTGAASQAQILGFSTTGVSTDVTATFPHTWGNTDTMNLEGFYEAA